MKLLSLKKSSHKMKHFKAEGFWSAGFVALFCKRRNFEAIEGFLLSSSAVSEECVACVAECLSEQLEMVLCLENCTGTRSTFKAV